MITTARQLKDLIRSNFQKMYYGMHLLLPLRNEKR